MESELTLMAVHAHLTDNVLWPPTTPLRALSLMALVLPWLPLVAQVLGRLLSFDRLLASHE